MKEEKRQQLQSKLEDSRTYGLLQNLADLMDKYYVDAVLGVAIPGGIGDGIAAIVSIVYIFFSAFRIKSFALTMAIINNTLRDVLLGMIPFYVGDVIDVFHRNHQQNMALIRGYVEGDQEIISTINRKAAWSVVLFVCLCFMIFLMVKVVIWAGTQVIGLFS